MIANHMAAFFSMLNHPLYCLLSHHDINILNHAYIHKTNDIVASIHKNRFIHTLRAWINESSWFSSVQGTHVHLTPILSQNAQALTLIGIEYDENVRRNHKQIMINLFIVIVWFIVWM